MTDAAEDRARRLTNTIDQLLQQGEWEESAAIVAQAIRDAVAEETEACARQLEGFATNAGDDYAACIRARQSEEG